MDKKTDGQQLLDGWLRKGESLFDKGLEQVKQIDMEALAHRSKGAVEKMIDTVASFRPKAALDQTTAAVESFKNDPAVADKGILAGARWLAKVVGLPDPLTGEKLK